MRFKLSNEEYQQQLAMLRKGTTIGQCLARGHAPSHQTGSNFRCAILKMQATGGAGCPAGKRQVDEIRRAACAGT